MLLHSGSTLLTPTIEKLGCIAFARAVVFVSGFFAAATVTGSCDQPSAAGAA